jgi:hypothetical protein
MKALCKLFAEIPQDIRNKPQSIKGVTHLPTAGRLGRRRTQLRQRPR